MIALGFEPRTSALSERRSNQAELRNRRIQKDKAFINIILTIKMKKHDLMIKLLIFFVAVELVLTGFLSYQSLTSIQGFCVIGDETGGCSDVQNSIYGDIFGVKLSYFGLISFLVLSGVLSRDFKKKKISGLFIWLAFIGGVFALYFIYLQIFVLKQICNTCMVIDSLAIVIFFVSLYAKKAPLV